MSSDRFRKIGYSLTRVIGAKNYARLRNLIKIGAPLHLENPRTFSDLVQRRMLFEHTDALSWTCDKEAMKEHVAARDVPVKIPDTLLFAPNLEALKYFNVPGDWVIKPNNSSGAVWFGSGAIDESELARITNYFHSHVTPFDYTGEWAYSQARTGYIVESLLAEPPLPDYKVFVFHGFAVFVDVHTDRGIDRHVTPFDREWNQIEHGKKAPRSDTPIPKPANLETLLECAEKIADGYDFMRVDFYLVNDEIYFGETTPYPGSGTVRMAPAFDSWLGGLWLSHSKDDVCQKYPEISRFQVPQNGE